MYYPANKCVYAIQWLYIAAYIHVPVLFMFIIIYYLAFLFRNFALQYTGYYGEDWLDVLQGNTKTGI